MAAALGVGAAHQVTGAEPAGASGPDDGSVTPSKFAPSAVDPDHEVPGARTLGPGPWQAAPGSVVANMRARDLDPHDFGVIEADGTGARAAIEAAMTVANIQGGGGSIRLRPNQVYDVGTGLSLAGFSSGIVGQGAGHSGDQATGSVIVARHQTGAVIDLEGFRYPRDHRGKVPFRSFAVEGSGEPGRELVGVALRRTGTGNKGSTSGICVDNLVISNTGGTCLEVDRLYLSEVTNVVLVEPVAVVENDIPYFVSRGSNNSYFARIGIRGLSRRANVGPSGAAIVTCSPRQAAKALDSHSNVFDSWWYEFARMPSGSTLLQIESWGNVIRDFSWVDCSQDPGADDTSYIRISGPPEPTLNPVSGGNFVTGIIPGRGTNANSIRWGVDVYAPYNRISGLKGYKGHNVRLRPTVHSTHVDLGGSVSGASDPGVIDESGPAISTAAHIAPNHSSDSFDGRSTTLAGEGPLPVASEHRRGRLWLVPGGEGSGDELHLCMKRADGGFEWRRLS